MVYAMIHERQAGLGCAGWKQEGSTRTLSVLIQSHCTTQDIAFQTADANGQSGMRAATVTISCPGSTRRVTVIETKAAHFQISVRC